MVACCPKLDDNLFFNADATAIIDKKNHRDRTIRDGFRCLFLGKQQELISKLDKSFPELGVEAKDCIEMNWV